MLLLLFRLHGDRYAIDARQVVEVLPLVAYKRLASAPRGMTGLFSYRGAPIPVIDIGDLLFGEPASARLSTRLIVVRDPSRQDGATLVALLAEHATETVRRPESDFVATGANTPGLGPVATDAQGVLQLLDLVTLVPSVLRESLGTGAGTR